MIYVAGDLHGFAGLSRLKDWNEGRGSLCVGITWQKIVAEVRDVLQLR